MTLPHSWILCCVPDEDMHHGVCCANGKQLQAAGNVVGSWVIASTWWVVQPVLGWEMRESPFSHQM